MSKTVIQVENLSKRYRIGLKETKHETFAEQVVAALKSPLKNFRRLRSMSRFREEDESVFWALKDINFEVKQGEVLGIIGHNGAGKSTLLKILSRVTEPTSGQVRIHGRISALLEVGTGFHQDLTGRENIYMNGTILGMTKREIDRKFDEIVDFSGVEKYIDTPVKFYSSGMKVRLGFAVAAHLEPEILILDEVLSVGDAEFQRKCLGKMEDVAGNGRTVLFVSHNMAAVKSLCSRSILLKSGKILFNGETVECIHFYQKTLILPITGKASWGISQAPGNENIRILQIEAKPIEGIILNTDSGINLGITFWNSVENINFDITVELLTDDEMVIFHRGTIVTTSRNSKQGFYSAIVEIPPFLLNAGLYKVRLIFGENQRYLLLATEVLFAFELENTNTLQGSNMSNTPGIIRPQLLWKTQYIGSTEYAVTSDR